MCSLRRKKAPRNLVLVCAESHEEKWNKESGALGVIPTLLTLQCGENGLKALSGPKEQQQRKS